MSTWYQAAGWVGMSLVLGAFALLSSRRLDSDSARYQGLNAVGALFMVVSTWANRSWPSVALNVAWCAIGLLALISTLRARARTKAAEDGAPAGDTSPQRHSDVHG